MCIIILATNKRITKELLTSAVQQNPDGIGFGWINQAGCAEFKKGVSLEQAKHLIKSLPMPYFLHARIATVGKIKSELAHPFACDATASYGTSYVAPDCHSSILAHNGHWNKWDDVTLQSLLGRGDAMPLGPWSDSRALAWLVGRHGIGFLRLINPGRVIVLNGDGYSLHGDWIESQGYHMSHTMYSSNVTVTKYPNNYGYHTTGKGYQWTKPEYEYDQLPLNNRLAEYCD